MKKLLKNMLKSIEDANKKNFGSKKMDCCDLNKSPKKKEDREIQNQKR